MSSSRNAPLSTHHSPPRVKKAIVNAARPAPSSKAALTPKITIKAAKIGRKIKKEEEEVFEEDGNDDDMGSSFLQFCAMCEKQILVPNSSILYCSESCRRRDAATTTSSPYLTSLGSPTKVAPSYNNLKVSATKIPTYIPALQPTPRTIPDGRIPAKFHDGKSDLDPTEWKPADPTIAGGKSPTQPGEWKPKLTHRSSSEASSYLSKFHHSSESLTSKRRPMVGHSGMTVSSRSIPGLSDTPTASTSSEESLSGTPYEFVGRSALSMPVRPANIASGGINASNDLTYEKKRVRTSLGSASGSLKKLLENTAGGM